MYIHLTLVPVVGGSGEIKTKPTQHSVKELRGIGIQPDVLLCRCHAAVPAEQRRKIALFTNVEERAVISAVDADDIYRIPLLLHEQGLDAIVCEKLGLEVPPADLREWQQVVTARHAFEATVDVAMVGKYVQIRDSYLSLNEALLHAGLADPHARQRALTSSPRSIETSGTACLDGMDAILVPGGFGERGIEGKIAAVRFAREQRHPVPRHLPRHAGRGDRIRAPRARAGGRSFDRVPARRRDPVIALITEWQDRSGTRWTRDDRSDLGGTMRLGAQAAQLAARDAGTRALWTRCRSTSATGIAMSSTTTISSGWRQAGLRFSGFSDDGLVEIVELPSHPWFIGVQFHPEFTSKPRDGHPLFTGFVSAAREHAAGRLPQAASA